LFVLVGFPFLRLPGFHVDGLWHGLLGALLYSVLAWALSKLLSEARR